MKGVQDDARPLVDISPPVVNTPVGGQVYTSPMYVDITRGEGGHYAAKKFKIDFHVNGPFGERDANLGRYLQDLIPGPHQLHTVAIWFSGSQTEESSWVGIDWFYVLTPPRTS
jgi:hypothetical protein